MANKLITISALALAYAQAHPQDRYQKVGNEVGQVYSNIGKLLSANTYDAQQLASAAEDADYAIASLKNEIRTMDWSYLGPQAAKQQVDNLEAYVNGLDGANQQLHALATQAAQNAYTNQVNALKDNQGYYQAQYGAYAQNRGNAAAPTGFPKIQAKAVVKDASQTTTTSESKPTDAKESKSESKESKSESKSAEREAKSESKEAKSESKSESKSAAAAAASGHRNSTNSTSSNPKASSASIEPKKSKNGAAVVTLSGGALIAGIFALL